MTGREGVAASTPSRRRAAPPRTQHRYEPRAEGVSDRARHATARRPLSRRPGLCRRTGRRQEAPEHLTRATSMYREMDMPFWLPEVEAELRALA